MVASVARRGFAATRLSDLTEASGISSKSFYELFPDKDSCLLATVEALLDGPFDVEDTAAFAEAIAEQPAAAKLCLIEAHAGDARVRERLRQATSSFEGRAVRAARELPGGEAYPEEMISAYVGAIAEIARRHLRLASEAELPDLLRELAPRLVESYPPPPEPLRMATRRQRAGTETHSPTDHAERILQAMIEVVAEQGYAKTTIDQIVKRAGISASMFYAHFGSKEDTLLAAIDSGGAQVVAAVLPAFRRGSGWPHAMRAGIGAFFNLLASRPALARLMMVEVHAGGPAALERREEALRPLGALWAEARRRSSGTVPVAFEAIFGAILHLAFRRIESTGPDGLPSLAPVSTYLALAPFTGPEVAATAANEEGRGPLSRGLDPEAIRAATIQPVKHGALNILSRSEATVSTIAAALEVPESVVGDNLEAMARIGLVKLAREGNERREDLYRSDLGEIHTEDWGRLSLAEREEISAQIRTMVDADLDRSIESGTFEQRPERVLVRAPLVVDEKGWHELSELQSATLSATLEIQARSKTRLAETKEEGIATRAVLMLFELPSGSALSEEGAAGEGPVEP
jgi:AcrR family transcriptional regulator